MAFLLMLALIAEGEKEFFEMVDERQAKGHSWHYVGRTEVTDKYIAFGAKEQDTGKEVFYWEIKNSNSK